MSPHGEVGNKILKGGYGAFLDILVIVYVLHDPAANLKALNNSSCILDLKLISKSWKKNKMNLKPQI